MTAWDPFGRQAEAQAAANRDAAGRRREEERALVRAVFGTAAGQRWLEQQRARHAARPSYVPGASFDAVAYAEGRKAFLAEIEALLTVPPQSKT